MNKELFSQDEISELEALEVRGGNTASIMSQNGCVNNAKGCGAGVDQLKCVNEVKNCGTPSYMDCTIVTYGQCGPED